MWFFRIACLTYIVWHFYCCCYCCLWVIDRMSDEIRFKHMKCRVAVTITFNLIFCVAFIIIFVIETSKTNDESTWIEQTVINLGFCLAIFNLVLLIVVYSQKFDDDGLFYLMDIFPFFKLSAAMVIGIGVILFSLLAVTCILYTIGQCCLKSVSDVVPQCIKTRIDCIFGNWYACCNCMDDDYLDENEILLHRPSRDSTFN